MRDARVKKERKHNIIRINSQINFASTNFFFLYLRKLEMQSLTSEKYTEKKSIAEEFKKLARYI